MAKSPLLLAAGSKDRIKMQSLGEMQKSFQLTHPTVVFIAHPDLGVPYPLTITEGSISYDFPCNEEEYWAWIGFIEEAGADHAIALAAEIDEVRRPPEHKCYHLWLSVTWYERVYALLTKAYGQTLQERDSAMSIKLRREKAKATALKEEYDILLTQYRVLRNENRDLLMDLGAKAKLISTLSYKVALVEEELLGVATLKEALAAIQKIAQHQM